MTIIIESVCIIGHRGGQKKTAAPKQMVEITTEVQTSDFDDESQQSKGQHTGKCIRQFAGIYAYCRYFIDRKW